MALLTVVSFDERRCLVNLDYGGVASVVKNV